jgi:hypothetical protein
VLVAVVTVAAAEAVMSMQITKPQFLILKQKNYNFMKILVK